MNEDVWLYNVDKQTKIDFPPEVRGTFYIVSKITALCLEHRHDILVPDTNGVHLSKLEFTMTGFVAKRQNTIKLEKEVQTEAIKMWVNESSQTEITKYSRGKFNKVKSGKVKLEHIVKRQRLKTNRLKVKCPDCRKRYSINTMGNNCDCGTSKAFMTTLEGKRPTFGSGIAGIIWYQESGMGFSTET